MACCILQIEGGARIDDGNVEQERLVLESRVVVEECPPSVDMSRRNGMCMYVWSHIKQEYGSTGKVANPARGQLNRENEYFPVPVRA